jgi:hypothetical protein
MKAIAIERDLGTIIATKAIATAAPVPIIASIIASKGTATIFPSQAHA